MDIQELNKPQLLLLAVFLSFVTSIATGITTVTLMEQAPVSVTAPINRVVQQTVEKIVQVEGKTSVQTVIVKEEDLVVDAIEKNKSALFTITREILGPEDKYIEIGVGRGFIVSNSDVLAADAFLIPNDGNYYVKGDSGKFKAKFMVADTSGVTFLKIGAPLDEKNKLVYTLPTFADFSKMKIGQKILMVGSSISSFMFEGNKNLRLNVSKSNGGGIVLNLDGEVLGMALSGDDVSFISIDSISEALKAAETPKTE
jgi:S1-C subfamily serine protease